MNRYLLSFVIVLSFLSAGKAQILHGFLNLSPANNISVDVTVNVNKNEVMIVMTGPSNAWYSVGFGKGNMFNAYSLVTNGMGVSSERKLGNHTGGIALASSYISNSTSVNGGVRTDTIVRAIAGLNGNYFTFPSAPGTFSVIWARGAGTNLSNHGNSNRGATFMTLSTACSNTTTQLPGVTICPGDSVLIGGMYRTAAGTYNDSIMSRRGCDSVNSITVTVAPINKTLSTGLKTITSNSSGATSYQWLENCMSAPQVINGATSQQYSPTMAGDFSVIIDQNGCVDTSDCISFSPTIGLGEESAKSFEIYPNPVIDDLRIDFNSAQSVSIKLLTLDGKVLKQVDFENVESTRFSLNDFAAGTYLLVVQGESYKEVKTVVKL